MSERQDDPRLKYVGIDVHLHTSTCCVLDANGKRLELRTIRGHWTRMIDYLRTIDGPLSACFEASCAYGMVYDELHRFCRSVTVAHPKHLRLICHATRKNDRVDALKLAKLLYLDEVPRVHVPSQDVRSWRELIELRRWEIHQTSRVKNCIRAVMRTYGIQPPADMAVLWTVQGRRWLDTIPWPTPSAALRAQVLLDQWDHIGRQIQVLTGMLDERAEKHAGVQLLCTIPGVGARTAEAVLAYIDDPKRFTRLSRACAYAGLAIREDSSADTQRLGHITKEGPATLRWLLVEAAWQVVRRDPSMRQYYQRIKRAKKENAKIAIVAVARKLLRRMVSMLRSGEAWNPPAIVSIASQRTSAAASV